MYHIPNNWSPRELSSSFFALKRMWNSCSPIEEVDNVGLEPWREDCEIFRAQAPTSHKGLGSAFGKHHGFWFLFMVKMSAKVEELLQWSQLIWADGLASILGFWRGSASFAVYCLFATKFPYRRWFGIIAFYFLFYCKWLLINKIVS